VLDLIGVLILQMCSSLINNKTSNLDKENHDCVWVSDLDYHRFLQSYFSVFCSKFQFLICISHTQDIV